MTLSTWVKLDRLPSASDGSYQGIFDSAEDAYVLFLDKGARELRFKVTAGAVRAAWHPRIGSGHEQLAPCRRRLRRGAGVARIYLDGNLVDMHADDSTGSNGLRGVVGTQTIYFGRNGTDVTTYFDGKIDETAVWSRAMSRAEIRYLYNGGAGLPLHASNPFVASACAVVRWSSRAISITRAPAGRGVQRDAHQRAGRLDRLHDRRTRPGARAGQPRHADRRRLREHPVPVDRRRHDRLLVQAGDHDQYQTIFDNSANADDWEMWI